MTTASTLRRHVAIAAIVVVMGAALLAAVLAAGNYEVVAKGQLLPYTEGRVYRVRFFDRFEFWVEPEHRLSADAVTAYFLTGIAFVSLTFAWSLWRLGHARGPTMYALMFAGATYLAADEYLGLHESIGHNLPFLMALPGVTRPDDVIVALYALPAALFLWIYRRQLTVSRHALRLFALGFGLFVVAALGDIANMAGEELLEAAAAVAIVLAVIETGLTHLRDGPAQ